MMAIRFKYIDLAAKAAFAIASVVILAYFFRYHSSSGSNGAIAANQGGREARRGSEDVNLIKLSESHTEHAIMGSGGPKSVLPNRRSVYERSCPDTSYSRGAHVNTVDSAGINSAEDDGLRDVEPGLSSGIIFMLPRPKRILTESPDNSQISRYLSAEDGLKVSIYCDSTLCTTSESQRQPKVLGAGYLNERLTVSSIGAFMDVQWPIFCKQQRKIRKSESINPSNDITYIEKINIIIQRFRLFNESVSVAGYKFKVHPSGTIDVHVISKDGVRYALATLSQLMNQPGRVQLPLSVQDWPSRPWRGMLIDVARHYLPMKSLRRMLDTMQALKMNVLHLHLTDSQSFPVLLEDTKSYNLSQFATLGSFSPDQVYTLEQLRALVAYAAERGIEIVPEIDVPAHTRAWDKGFPGLVVRCPKTVAVRGAGAASSTDIPALDISHPHVVPIIREVLTQIASVFPSRYLHIGGDEVIPECWSESEAMQSLRKSSGDKSWNQLLLDFEEKIFAEVRRLRKIPIVWQGIVDSGSMPTETLPQPPVGGNATYRDEVLSTSAPAVVQPWKCWSNMDVNAARSAARQGNRVISAACLYLDWDVDWENYFATESLVAAETAANAYASLAKSPAVATSTSSSNDRSAKKLAKKRYNSSAPSLITTGSNRRFLMSRQGDDPTDSSEHNLRLYKLAGNLDREADLPVENVSPSERRRLELLETTSVARPDPLTGQLPVFLGGEGAMWTERVDYSNLECRLWPRGAVVASVLWGFDDRDPISPDVSAVQSLRKKSSSNFRETFKFLSNNMRIFASNSITIHQDDSRECSRGPKAPSGSSNTLPKKKQFTPLQFSSVYKLIDYLKSDMQCIISRNETYTLPKVTSQCPMIPAHFRAPLVPVTSSDGQSVYSKISDDASSQIEGNIIMSQMHSSSVKNDFVFVNVKATLLNINNGGDSRLNTLKTWFAERASLGDLFIGICEANNWHELRGTTERKDNYQNILFYSSDSGFVHSYVLSSPEHPYNLAFLSRLPFKVVATYRPPTLLRGLLHVYFELLDLHVFLVHLTPHSSAKRREEALFVKNTMKPFIDNGDRVILMGDLNTFSRVDDAVLYRPGAPVCIDELRDAEYYNKEGVVATAPVSSTHMGAELLKRMERVCIKQGENISYIGFLNVITQSDHHVFVRYRKKYCIESVPSGNDSTDKRLKSLSIDYEPFNVIASTGLRDACEASCSTASGDSDSYAFNEKQDFQDEEYVVCMKSRCGNSEPTHYDPEWPEDVLKSPAPSVRVDYILLSESIVKASVGFSAHRKHSLYISTLATTRRDRNEKKNGVTFNAHKNSSKGRAISSQRTSDASASALTSRMLRVSLSREGLGGSASVAPVAAASASGPAISASIIKSNSTYHLSDHYPVHVAFILRSPAAFWRR